MASHRKEILAIALPAIVSNITTPLLGLVDVAVTGRIGAAVYIGAIAVGGTMFNMIYWLFGFLRMGSGGLTAQAYGAGDARRQALVLYRALLIALAAGVLMVLLSKPLAALVLGFMDADGATAALAAEYFGICIYGAPAVLAGYALAGWFIGMQNSRAAMWMAILTNVVNIAVSMTLVFGLDRKIAGVATGTMSAQWAGVLLGLIIVLRKYRPALPPLQSLLHRRELAAFFSINADIFLRTCCLVAVTVWFTHAGALQGTDILAANALLLQLFMLFSYFMDGFAYAGEALAGKYAGRADRASLATLISSLMRTGLRWALLFAVLYGLFGEWFMRMLAEVPEVVTTAKEYLWWAVLIPLCGFLAFIWDGIFVGLVATRAMLVSMAIAIAVFFGLYFSLRSTLANDALWLAFDVYLLVRGVAEWCLSRRIVARIKIQS
ncbi:MAG: MATE family efflux transporter [Muribaculaceae bacterium]|nr:MATE family efflux transporter [Muribaculaceae bacterium]